ncbi:MAG TPA: C2 domain-containing protein [Fimbriimonadaceae bacterium]|nr:C2 domain-containing protein [Fimbriimonadaceae bacterium]
MAAAILGLTGSTISEAGQQQPTFKTVTVTIHRVAATDNLDGDFIKKDEADFYARVWIGGFSHRTETMSKDDARPNWRISESVTANVVPIKICMMDDDGGLEEKDDHVDINPQEGEKCLNLWYNTTTGQISGDLAGPSTRMFATRGGGKDSDKARIWFSISHQ